jgi:hypothetical protein
MLAFSGYLSAAVPNDVVGYGKTTWGMTAEEVYKVESPRIIRLDSPIKFTKSNAPLVIKNIEIASQEFEAIFLFNDSDNSFKQVNLTSLERKNSGINSRTFNSLENLLTNKYGSPTYKDEGKVVTWKFPSTVIELQHMYIPGIITSVVVAYKPSSAGESATKDL